MKTNLYLAATALLLAVACKNEEKKPVEINQKPELSALMQKQIELAEVHASPVVSYLKTFGKIITDPNKSVDVFPAVGGNVSQVNVELGDYVRKGDILAVFNSTEVAGYHKDLVDAQGDLVVAQKNLKVAQEMFEGRLATEKDVVVARKEVESSLTEINRLKQLYKIYDLGANNTYYVKAPLSGFVTEKDITPNMLIRNDRSDNIFTISQIDDIWVMANVSESSINQVQVGTEAEIKTLAYPNETIVGKVDRIFNFIDPETKSMKVRIRLNNRDYRLKPQMNATVNLKFVKPEHQPMISSKALVFENSKNYVLVYKDSKHIEIRSVEVAQQNEDYAYIKKGVNPGEKVITKNALLVYRTLAN
jgi:membrane fusion protein, heavy metal efflux system